MGTMKTPAARRAALEVEAARIKSRLDELAKQIDGDPAAWLKLTERMSDNVAEVFVDKVLAEARQQAIALTGIIRALDGTAAQEGGSAVPVADPSDEMARRRADKLKAAQGQG
jgi:hypothetical protein